MSWRVVRRGCCLSLLLSPLCGCSLFEKRESAYFDRAPGVASARTSRQAASPVKPAAAEGEPAGGRGGGRELALADESAAGRDGLQPVKAESRGSPPAGAANRPDREPDVPDVPKPNAAKEPPAAANGKPAPKAGNAAANAAGAAPPHAGPEGGPMLPPLEDPHVRPTPTAMGSVMQLPPGESPVERALELTKRMDILTVEKKALNLRVCALEEAMLAATKQMTSVTRQVEEAGSEVARARKDLQTWADDLREQQGRLRQQEKENQELLKMVIATLEKMLGAEGPGPGLPKLAAGEP